MAWWTDTALAALLGGRYVWLPEWGNLNYAHPERGIAIADVEAGWAKVQAIRSGPRGHRVILLCACKDFGSCHRGVLSAWIRDTQGIATAELALPEIVRARKADNAPALDFGDGGGTGTRRKPQLAA